MIMKREPDDGSESDEKVAPGDLLRYSHSVTFTERELKAFRYLARKQGRSVSAVVRDVCFDPNVLEPWLTAVEAEIQADKQKGRSAWTHPAKRQPQQRRQRATNLN